MALKNKHTKNYLNKYRSFFSQTVNVNSIYLTNCENKAMVMWRVMKKISPSHATSKILHIRGLCSHGNQDKFALMGFKHQETVAFQSAILYIYAIRLFPPSYHTIMVAPEKSNRTNVSFNCHFLGNKVSMYLSDNVNANTPCSGGYSLMSPGRGRASDNFVIVYSTALVLLFSRIYRIK